MKFLRAVAIAGVSFVVGCSLLVDTDGLSSPDAGEAGAPDAGKDAVAIVDAAAIVDAPVIDAMPDVQEAAAPIDAGVDATPPARTTVSCAVPSVCADREGCCVVYGSTDDFCTGEASKCVFGTNKTVWAQCDDETDCAALGEPGSVCCAQIAIDGTFMSVGCAKTCPDTQLCDATLKQCPDGKTCVKGKYASDIWSCE